MNIPNILTSFRLFLVPVFALIFFSSIQNNIFYSIMIFLLAGLTDILDGYIARKFNIVTKWGIVADPFADKLMLLTVLVCLTIKNFIPFWMVIVIATKEMSMILVGIICYKRGIVIPSNKFGKISTLLFYISIFILIFNNNLGYYLLCIAVASAIIAFINYFIIYINK